MPGPRASASWPAAEARRSRTLPTMPDDDARPVLFFDRVLPDGVLELVDGRAVVVGPDDRDLARADAVIAGIRRWDGTAMDLGPRLRVISRTGVGYDTVDVEAATARGI